MQRLFDKGGKITFLNINVIIAVHQRTAQKDRKQKEDLKGFDLSERRRNLLRLFVEELGLHAAERGNFQLEFSLLFGETDADPIRLIARDNGEPYDIIKAAQRENLSFREYFIDSVTADLPVRKYQAAGDENRLTLQV